MVVPRAKNRLGWLSKASGAWDLRQAGVSGLGGWGLGIRKPPGLAFWVLGLGFRAQGLGFGV